MILYVTPNSPYARIARIAVREAGLLSVTTEITARNRRDDNPVLDHSPVGRVPTLVTPTGQVVTEVRYVVDTIAEIAGLHAMRSARSGQAGSAETEGLALGFLEGIAVWVRENRRGVLRSPDLLAVEARRCDRCLNALDVKVQDEMLQSLPAFASITTLAALDLMDAHKLRPSWHVAFPSLSAWFNEARTREAAATTRPIL